MARETCFTQHAIFSYGDFYSLGPRPVLSIKLLLIWYLCHLFRSTLTEFGFTAASSLVSAADKAKGEALTFDLTLTRYLTLKTKFYFKTALKQIPSEIPIAASRASYAH